MNGLYVMDLSRFDDVYGPQERAAIERLVTIQAPPNAAIDRTTEVLVTGWGAPRLTKELLDQAPNLKLVLYGAGSVRNVVTPESWARGVRITTAAEAIAISVAEFAVSQILYALKHGWRYVLGSRRTGAPVPRGSEPGANGSVVGLVGLGKTGRATRRLLEKNHDVKVQVADPYTTEPTVGLVELFATSDVVSLHAPLLDSTSKMVDRARLTAMKPNATLINTARGGLIDEPALIEVLRQREDLFAVLDVTNPEPPIPGSPLFELPNVVVTPHLAGSLGTERRRQGRLMADELRRYVAGEPLRHEVFEHLMSTTA